MSDIAKKIVRESGNSFQCKVANFFRSNGWDVLISPYYVDSSTDKTREIDLIVEKKYAVPNIFGRRSNKEICVRLFVECKYISKEVVFWFDHIDKDLALNWISANSPFKKNNTYIQQQHQIKRSDGAAKLFASEHSKGEENDPIFRAINQCLSGFVYNRGRELAPAAHPNISVTRLEYPVIICSAFEKFHGTSVNDESVLEALNDYFLLEVDYAYVVNAIRATKREYFLIDVVDYAFLSNFLNEIDKEVEAARVLVGDN